MTSPGKRSAGPRPYRRWSEADREVLRREWQPGRNNDELAARMGRTVPGIRAQAKKMGLCKPGGHARWTREQDDRLKDLVGRLSDREVARRMKRSVNSVRVRVTRLGLSWRDRDGWYTASEAAEIMGVDRHWVLARIQQGTLRAEPAGPHQPQKKGMAAWRIAEGDLRAFLRRYAHELCGRNVDLVRIVEILAGLDYGG